MVVHITPNFSTRPTQPVRRWAPFALGFRPFFLLASLIAIGLLGHWLAVLGRGIGGGGGYFDPLIWHSHELLFGYATAVIAGFLLTAAQNWTGLPTPRNLPLALLALLWLVGRVAIALPAGLLPGWLVAGLDLAFLPLIALAVGRRVWAKRQQNNYPFVAILAGLSVANLLIHLRVLGAWPAFDASTGLFAALYLVILLLIVLGGRVIPFFTERTLPGITTRKWPWIERLAPIATAALALVALFQPSGALAALLAALACLVNAVRLWGWQPWRTGREPMLWVLHLGYGWLVLGLGLTAVAPWLPTLAMPAVHALTVGALGGLTLGMMARVALGHTGRPIQAAPVVIATFVLINLAAIARVFLPSLWPTHYLSLLMIAGGLWSLAFLLFLFHYVPILLRPRIDGKEG